MGSGIPEYFQHGKYSIDPCDVSRLLLHCEPEQVREKVIVTPIWGQEFLAEAADNIEPVAGDMVFDVSYREEMFSLLLSGVGAPLTGDVVLALGCTPCQYLIFTGSFGGLTEVLNIGDLLVITESIAGDGFSNYLGQSQLSAQAFLKPVRPDSMLNDLLEEHARIIASEKGVTLHKDKIFCSDTIVAEYFHLDTMTDRYNCIGVEMETSAVFNAAPLVGIRAAALLMVSDVIPANKSLFTGRTEEDRARRKYVREQILSRIILDTLADGRLD